jgi:NAD dependent epimerase/dehydratase family enzyme
MKFFAGAIPGTGKQMCSWVHIDDLCELFIYLFENKLSGTYNSVAPKPESIEKISQQVAKRIHRPIILPNIPKFMLSLIFGKERHELLLCDQNISSEKIQKTGFKFTYKTSEEAINNLL